MELSLVVYRQYITGQEKPASAGLRMSDRYVQCGPFSSMRGSLLVVPAPVTLRTQTGLYGFIISKNYINIIRSKLNTSTCSLHKITKITIPLHSTIFDVNLSFYRSI